MEPTKRQGKQPANSNSYNDRDEADRDEEDDYPKLNPAIVEKYGTKGIKHTRQFIRPVKPNSFSPERVEEYIRFVMRNTFPEGCKGLEDVNPETYAEWFEYFMFNTKWMPEDDILIRECFSNKCAEIMQEDEDEHEDLSDGEFSDLLDEIYRSGYQIDVDALLAQVKNSFDVTHPNLVRYKDVETSVFYKECEGREIIVPASTTSRNVAHDETPLAKPANDETSVENDVALRSIVRDVTNEDQE